ncbi:MAG: alpha/beta hydrolase [Nocardioidaceae bacterium]|nr:alpha/beta hydrolase [Nocardioidaceae bacterium]
MTSPGPVPRNGSPDSEPWTSRFLSANGSRFHVVEAGSGPLVLLLHGFPQFWWAWRHQLTALARAGFRTCALDLRGYGDSDKPPRGYDPFTLAADVAGISRELTTDQVTVVGQGWGGYVGWAVSAAYPDIVNGLCTVGAPHPSELLHPPLSLLTRAPTRHLAAMQVPWLPERRIMSGNYIERHLRAWSAPGSTFPSTDEGARYRQALASWPSPHCALEYHRWLLRSRLRADGRAFARLMRHPIRVDVLQVSGSHDPAVHPTAITRSRRHVAGSYAEAMVHGAGHFAPEERPDEFTGILLDWLVRL